MTQRRTGCARRRATRARRVVGIVMMATFLGTATNGTLAAAGQSGGAADVTLGTIALSIPTLADGQALPPGTYELRLTSRHATAVPAGPPPEVNPWVELIQGGVVKAQEIATRIPASEIGTVAKTTLPGAGMAKVELLKESEYLRIWVNHDGQHYLIHLTRG